MGLTLTRIGESDQRLPDKSVRDGKDLSARFTESLTDHRNRGWSSGPDHQRQGAPGRGRRKRVGHIGPLPGRYAQSWLSPGIYRRVCYRGHSGQLRRSPGDGDEVCDGGVTFKVQFQSAKFALWKINDRFQPIRALSSGRLFCFCLRKIVSVRRKAFENLKKYAIFCILEL